MSLNPEAVRARLHRHDHRVGRGDQRRTIVDEDLARWRSKVHRHVPMNRAQRLRCHGRNCSVLRVMRVSCPEADLRGRISRKENAAYAERQHKNNHSRPYQFRRTVHESSFWTERDNVTVQAKHK